MIPSHRAIEACIEPTSRLCIELTSSPASRHNIERQAFIEPCRVMHRAIDNSQLSRHNIPLPPSPVSSLSCKAVSSLSCSLSVAPSQLHPVDVAQPEHNQYTLCGHLRTSRAGSHCHCAQRCCAGAALVHRSSVGSPLQRRRPCSVTGAQSATDHSAHGTRLVP